MPLKSLPNRAPPDLVTNGRNWEWLFNQTLTKADLDLTGLTGDVTVSAAGATAIGTGVIVDADLTPNTLSAALPNLGTWFSTPPNTNGANNITATANQTYYCQIFVPCKTTLTGIYYLVSTTASGNVRSSIYNPAGTRVANRTTNSAQPGANSGHQVAFDAPVAFNPGYYFAALTFSSATATFWGGFPATPCNSAAGAGAGATAVSITPPTIPAANIPTMSTY